MNVPGPVETCPDRGKAAAFGLPLFLAACLCLGAPLGQAGGASAGQTTASAPTGTDLRPDIKLPYIVKKGDTLWDIANYFFKDPGKWLNIWEQNLYITNPDLIYPGNQINFAVEKAAKTGGLTVVRSAPRVHSLPAQRLEPPIDQSIIVTALTRQDFIRPGDVEASGYVLDSRDERINYGANDRIYLRLRQPAEEGSVLDVFRSTEPVRDPTSDEIAGVLVKHLGQVRVTGQKGGITEGVVLRAFEEISRGDRVKPARVIDTRIQPDYPDRELAGHIMYIRNHATEAGQNQVVGINLGEEDGLKAGSMLRVLRAGRTVRDKTSGQAVTLPEENIGQLIVLVPQSHASIALISRSTFPINRGDAVRSAERP